MKKIDISKLVLEGLIGTFLSIAVEGAFQIIKNRKKKESIDNTMVSDLTVAELKQILREEA